MSENAETLSKRFTFVPPGGGSDHDWSADHIFVKVSAADTGGQYTLVEDNLKANFALGLHMHRYLTPRPSTSSKGRSISLSMASG